MTMTQYKNELRKKYPPILSLEDVRIILRISRRKASWMLQNGIIKCTNNGKKTKQYAVDIDDLFDYFKKVEINDPSVRIPSGIFSSRVAEQASRKLLLDAIHAVPSADFSLFLADEWCEYDDLLYWNDVVKITGYAKTTVNKWMADKLLKKAIAQDGHFTTKEWLIEFYQEYAYKIEGKSQKHILLLTKYYRQAQ